MQLVFLLYRVSRETELEISLVARIVLRRKKSYVNSCMGIQDVMGPHLKELMVGGGRMGENR